MGKKGGSSKILMARGVVLALISSGVVFVIAQTSTSAAKEVPLQKIVVARADIAERTVMTAQLVREVGIPVDTVPRDSIGATTKVVIKFAKERVRAGQPILSPQIAETGKPGEERPQGLPGVAPAAPASGAPPPKTVDAAFVVGKGKVMVAVDYPEAAKLVTVGVLRPSDKVDIYIKAPGIMMSDGSSG